MTPADVFDSLGKQLGEVCHVSRNLALQGQHIEKFSLETGFEVSPALNKVTLFKSVRYLGGQIDAPKFNVKIVVY